MRSIETCPGLRLRDLIYSDIQIYVQDRIEENSKRQHLAKLHPVQASALTHNIMVKANRGFFLDQIGRTVSSKWVKKSR